MVRETEFDIKQSAGTVVRLINEGRTRKAIDLLEQQRQDKPLAVQEALDRYVAAGATERLEAATARPHGSNGRCVHRPGRRSALERIFRAQVSGI